MDRFVVRSASRSLSGSIDDPDDPPHTESILPDRDSQSMSDGMSQDPLASEPTSQETEVEPQTAQTPPSRSSSTDTVSADTSSATSSEAVTAPNPWPWVADFFHYLGAEKAKTGASTNLLFRCQLCHKNGSKRTVKANTTSRANLKSHIKLNHGSSFAQFEEMCSSNTRKRPAKTTVDEDVQPSIAPFFQPKGAQAKSGARGDWVTQAQVDDAIFKFVMETGQSFHVVEEPSFQALIKTLQPNKEVMGRKKLINKMQSQFDNLKAEITAALEKADYVSTTADIWSAGHRSFMGVTVHILTDGLVRRNFAIACQRMEGRHTHDAVANVLNTILSSWGIQYKCSGMVTDNASNFAKAFNVHGRQQQVKSKLFDVQRFFQR